MKGTQKRQSPGGNRGSKSNISMHRDDTPILQNATIGKWASILVAAGLDQSYLRNRHGPCPGCGGTDRFRFDDRQGRGTWYCGGGGAPQFGDGFALLEHVHGWGFRTAADHVRKVLGIGGQPPTAAPPRPASAQTPPPPDRLNRLRATWSQTHAIAWNGSDPATSYLQRRGLAAVLADPPDSLRLHPALPYWHGGQHIGNWPTLVAKIVDRNGVPVGLHRTYLNTAGQKAPVPGAVKKMSARWPGSLTAAAVRLYPITGGTLAIAEGIETALTIRAAGRGVGGLWAALSAHGLATVALPENVLHVEIWADHDKAGVDAARRLRNRARAEGRSCDVYLPPETGSDWLDVWHRQAREAA